ncbi:hypothetical protein BRC74_01095 [Halobacteriales archaeon QH_7_68_42]|nr:MAG: hypothetical protein BRC74_01095 [Halobacteriales archaeon QH_7_68_42]
MSGEDQGGAGRREVAYRLFAAEFEDADYSYSESDEERAPNYVVTPTGARVNRVFVVGVLTEVEEAGEDILRARIVDQTGAFVVYAGQYQPEAQTFFERADPPAFVAVTGKARTFQPDDSDVTYTSVRPENVNEVTAETRDRWSVQAARQTLDRVATMARALDREERGEELRGLLESRGVDVGLAAGIPLAIDHYGTTGAYLESVRTLAVQVAEVVAGERDEVDPLSRSPDASGPADLTDLATLEVPAGAGGEGEAVAASGSSDGTNAEPSGTASGSAADATTGADSGGTAETGGDVTETPASGDTAEVDESTAGTGDTGASSSETGAEPTVEGGDIGDFEPGEFDLDEEEREAIEEEYGTGFRSGTEVDEPGEADIDTPEPNADAEPVEAGGADAETADSEAAETVDTGASEPAEPTDEGESASTAEADAEPEPEEDAEPETAEDVDLDEAVMDAMQAEDDGDGAPEADIVEAVTGRLGVGEDEVREALDEALMGGKCYESEDGVYKPI